MFGIDLFVCSPDAALLIAFVKAVCCLFYRPCVLPIYVPP